MSAPRAFLVGCLSGTAALVGGFLLVRWLRDYADAAANELFAQPSEPTEAVVHNPPLRSVP